MYYLEEFIFSMKITLLAISNLENLIRLTATTASSACGRQGGGEPYMFQHAMLIAKPHICALQNLNLITWSYFISRYITVL